MPARCSVCVHPERKAIDHALISGLVSERQTARDHGINVSSVQRHKRRHLAALLTPGGAKDPSMRAHAASVRAAKGAKEAHLATYAEGIAADVGALRTKALELGAKAEESKDYRTALMAVRELTRLVELLHRVTVDDRRDARDVALHPAWQRLQHALLTALGPYPEAQGAVIIAIQNELNAHAGPLPGGTTALGVPMGGPA